MVSAKFHHFGVPTTHKSDNEAYVAGAKVFVTDPEKHPFRVEFLRFESDSPLAREVQTQSHAAFMVSSLEEALAGQKVIIPPFDATETLRCAFIKDGDAVIEVMEMR